MTPRNSTRRRKLLRARTLSEIERDSDKDVDRQLNQPEPSGPMFLRPTQELRTLERALVSDQYDSIFSRAQAKAIKTCLREVTTRHAPSAAGGWARGISGPRNDSANYGWERILIAAQLFELEGRIKPAKVRLSRERTQKTGTLRPLIEQYGRSSPLVRSIEREFGPGRPHNAVDSYVWEVCSVYEALSGKGVRPGKDRRLPRLLRVCLAPELFWWRGQRMSDWTTNSSVRRYEWQKRKRTRATYTLRPR